jgi:hypothetical protein
VSAYVLGVLVFLSGILAAATREPRRSLILNAPGLIAVITLVAAVVLGFSRGTKIAWAAGVLAVATVLVAATLRLGSRTPRNVA